MFVIPCKYSNSNNFIEPLINSIKLYMPNEKIAIYDSYSEDLSYLDKFEGIDIYCNNKGYVDSAIWNAYNTYKIEQFFYVLHDSMLLNGNVDYLRNNEFTSYMYFNSAWDNQYQINYSKEQINKTQIQWKDSFIGLFGITFFCKREVLDKLNNVGLSNIIPSNKNEMMASERIWGLALEHIGVDITKNTIKGDFSNRFQNAIIDKFFVGRE